MADFGFFGKALFVIFQKGVQEGEGEQDTSWGGTPMSVAGQDGELHHGAPHGTPMWHIPFMKGDILGHFGTFMCLLYPLVFL